MSPSALERLRRALELAESAAGEDPSSAQAAASAADAAERGLWRSGAPARVRAESARLSRVAEVLRQASVEAEDEGDPAARRRLALSRAAVSRSCASLRSAMEDASEGA